MTQLDISAVEARLTTTRLGRPLRYLETVASTQDEARALAAQGAAEGLVVVADRQTAGRGRSARTWWSPAGGLYLSLLLRPDLPGRLLPWVTMCVALGAAEAVERFGPPVDIKWPNDLEVRGRKLAGILSEGAFAGSRLDYVIAGLGINVDVDFISQPILRGSATSLVVETGEKVDPNGLLAAVLEHTEVHYLNLRRGISPQPAWKARLVTLDRPVEAIAGSGQIVRGVASRVLADGALCIRGPDGEETVVRAADVTLRPAGTFGSGQSRNPKPAGPSGR